MHFLLSLFCVVALPIAQADQSNNKLVIITSGSIPNVSVVLSPPVVVPAMAVSDLASGSSVTTEKTVLQAPLEGSIFHTGLGIVNGTPVFLHDPKQSVQEPSLSNTTAKTQSDDRDSVIHSVMKAVEHLSNLSAQNEIKRQQSPSSASSSNKESSFGQVATEIHFSPNATSSVKVVVVPLIQNAYDLNDRSNSAAAMAASNPIVVTRQEGNQTLVHVIVKRDSEIKLPISEHNSDGPLTNKDFITSTQSPQPLSTSNIIILNEIKQKSPSDGSNQVLLTTGQLLTAHVAIINGSENVDALPFLKAETIKSAAGNTSVLVVPSILIPIVPPIVESIEQTRPSREVVLTGGAPSPMQSRITAQEILQISTLPSAPRIPLDISEPINPKPLPVGMSEFLIPEHSNSSEVLSAAKN